MSIVFKLLLVVLLLFNNIESACKSKTVVHDFREVAIIKLSSTVEGTDSDYQCECNGYQLANDYQSSTQLIYINNQGCNSDIMWQGNGDEYCEYSDLTDWCKFWGCNTCEKPKCPYVRKTSNGAAGGGIYCSEQYDCVICGNEAPVININWQRINTAPMQQIERSSTNGEVWAIGKDNWVYKRGYDNWTWFKKNWQANAITVDQNGEIWWLNYGDPTTTPGGGRVYKGNPGTYIGCVTGACFKQISVSDDGQTLYAVSTDNKLYKRDGNSWSFVVSPAIQVAVDSNTNVWWIRSDNVAMQNNQERGCSGLDGEYGDCFEQLAVGTDGTVFGLTVNDGIFYYQVDNDQWRRVNGELTYITVANENVVWGINEDYNAIFKANNVENVKNAAIIPQIHA